MEDAFFKSKVGVYDKNQVKDYLLNDLPHLLLPNIEKLLNLEEGDD